jgi:DNA repair exonuclease SbcCD ATPase subunit
MKIKSVTINNILSIESATVTFDDSGLMLVKGWNYDDSRGNGAGKTALFNAISFALFDKLPRKITATEIVRRGCKTGSVELELEINHDRYLVRRSRPKGTHFEKITAGINTALTMTQEEWENLLGINYTQFVLTMYAAQGSSTRFLSINDADKKTFLLQLLNLEEFASARKLANDKADMLSKQIEQLNLSVLNKQSKMEAYQESVVDTDLLNNSIATIKQLINVITKQIISRQSVLKPNLSQYQRLEDEIAHKKNGFASIRAKREGLHDQYRKLSSKAGKLHDPASSCAVCGSILDTTAAKAAHEEETRLILEEIKTIKVAIDACDEKLIGEDSVNALSGKLKNKKHEELSEYECAVADIAELSSKLSLKEQEVKTLILKLTKNDELNCKIKALQEECAKITDVVNRGICELELYKTVASIYSPTGAQAYVLDSVVELFNERIAEYTSLLWSNASYTLLSSKENQKGDFVAKFSEEFVINGKSISIGSLSGGEFRALSLCTDFALIDVMERQFGIYMSPIILDEPFDGLDASGKELVVGLLETLSKDRLIVIVDHASEVQSMFSSVVSVEKRGGISSINMAS